MPVMSDKKDILETPGLNRRPYTVPDGYFADLQSRLMKIPQEAPAVEEQPAKVISLWDKLRPYAALAACFVAIVAVGTAVLRTPKTDTEDAQYEQLVLADLIPHSDPYFIYVDEDETESELTDEELIDYLMDNNVQIDYELD